jgi:hypoxanthine phosphoribosyltransferase
MLHFHSFILSTANSVLSGGREAAQTCAAMFAGAFTLSAAVLGVLGVQGQTLYFTIVILAILVPLAIVGLCYQLRWNLIAWALWRERFWFLNARPELLIAVGPGGAIIAGMVAKILNRSSNLEPAIVVANRKYYEAGDVMDREVHFELPKSLSLDRMNIVVVTSEVHSGRTLVKLGEICRRKYRHEKLRTFSILWNPKSDYRVTRYIIRSDARGILPWPDDPRRHEEVRELAIT